MVVFGCRAKYMLNHASDHIGQVSWELFAVVIVAGNFAKMSVFWLQGLVYVESESDHIGQVSCITTASNSQET